MDRLGVLDSRGDLVTLDRLRPLSLGFLGDLVGDGFRFGCRLDGGFVHLRRLGLRLAQLLGVNGPEPLRVGRRVGDLLGEVLRGDDLLVRRLVDRLGEIQGLGRGL